ncbi:MAG TPA: macro domain-containing protein [Candidatus Nanoarchaeia archaeon]|nr:macro domain-containing protein [Candidatus Nanoarchaeia archaeon]
MKIYLKRSNILHERVDALVNPTNSTGAMASGISAAIKNAGSATIEKDSRAQAPIAVGAAVLTLGYQLPAAHVIHVATTTKVVEPATAQNVELALAAALRLADERNFSSLAVPYLGNNIGPVQKEEIARAMLSALHAYQGQAIQEVFLIAHDVATEAMFRKLMQSSV